MMTNTKFLVGVLGAAAAGVVIGMLIAPEKGVELRRNIRKTTDDLVDDISKWIGKGKQFAKDVKGMAQEEMQEQINEQDR